MTDDLIKKVEEEIQARDEDGKANPIETPLEEVKRISEETKKIAEGNNKTLAKMQELQAEMQIGGRADAGQVDKPKTQEEQDQAEADKIVGAFN